MRWYYVALFVCILTVAEVAHADGLLNTGLLLDAPDLNAEDSRHSFLVQGAAEDTQYNLGTSFRYGSFIFGFESSLNDGGARNNGGGIIASAEGTLSSESRVISGSSHKMFLGLMLSRKFAVYGFNGLASKTIKRSASYSHSQEVENLSSDCDIRDAKTGGCYSDDDDHENDDGYNNLLTSGFNETEQSNLGHILGAGLEYALLGGSLRVEYAMTRMNDANQTLRLSTRNEDGDTVNAGPSTYNVRWNDYEQTVQMRWQARF